MAQQTSIFHGVMPALVTPFGADGRSLDSSSFERLLDAQLRLGVHGIVIAGATGEGCALSDAEIETLVAICAKRTGRKIPCVVGLFTNSTAQGVEFLKRFSTQAVDGFLAVVPYFNKPTQSGMCAHFSALREATRLPIAVYNHPGRTSVNMRPATVGMLARDGVIDAIKEGAGDMTQALEVLEAVDSRIPVLCGEDALFLPMLACGARGVISATANVLARELVGIFDAWEQGKCEQARELQIAALPRIRALFLETNPIPLKAILAAAGIIDHATLRLPLTPASPLVVDELRKVFSDLL